MSEASEAAAVGVAVAGRERVELVGEALQPLPGVIGGFVGADSSVSLAVARFSR